MNQEIKKKPTTNSPFNSCCSTTSTFFRSIATNDSSVSPPSDNRGKKKTREVHGTGVDLSGGGARPKKKTGMAQPSSQRRKKGVGRGGKKKTKGEGHICREEGEERGEDRGGRETCFLNCSVNPPLSLYFVCPSFSLAVVGDRPAIHHGRFSHLCGLKGA